MVDRERLIEILRVPLYQRIKAETAEEVADYLIDNDVVPVVYCVYIQTIKNGGVLGVLDEEYNIFITYKGEAE